VADDPTAEVTIWNPTIDPEKVATKKVAAIAAPAFASDGWVELDAAGRKKAAHPTTATTSSKEL